MENTMRFPAPTSPSVGIVRDLPHTWEVSDLGGAPVRSTTPGAGWQRGAIVRGSQPALTLTTATPMYDPTDIEQLNKGFGGTA